MENMVMSDKKIIWMCSCGCYWEHCKLDAEAHARLEGHELTEIDVSCDTQKLKKLQRESVKIV